VTQLLSFARRQTTEGLPMRVDELIRSVVSLFRVTADQQGVKFVTTLESERELAGTTVQAVRDAFSNLLLNALQAVPHGGQVSITVSENADGLFITVYDSGPGISPKLADRIWEPFFTTKQRGTGLGLAIVRKRMEEVGGAAQILETHNGGGACFQLRLPLT
jgi:signal transduction histidine kinase